MEFYQLRKVLVKAPDVRVSRRAVILQELRDPYRLTDGAIQNLLGELAELEQSLQADPPEVEADDEDEE